MAAAPVTKDLNDDQVDGGGHLRLVAAVEATVNEAMATKLVRLGVAAEAEAVGEPALLQASEAAAERTELAFGTGQPQRAAAASHAF